MLGVIAVVVVALPYKIFELDRYFVPKELVLGVAALIAAVTIVLRRRAIALDTADALLAVFLIWSTASALFATNHWLAQRTLGISVSSAIVFWAARRIGAETGYRSMLIACAVATVAAAAFALGQAYGLDSDYFTLNRAPGGTLGNRNFVAHIAAIGLPCLAWCTITARRGIGSFLGALGGAIVAAALVLSRSRAAWLAVVACVVVLFLPLLSSRKYWGLVSYGGRLSRFLLAGLIGGAIAIALPNRLNWNSESPYLDSAKGMVDYKRGSGKGRLAQYENSLRMAGAHPILGVGPGNWPVTYPHYAPSSDRSLAENGMTANPWPSSDWVAFVSERGFIAAIALFGVFASLFFGAFRGWNILPDGASVLAQLAVVGTIVAAIVVSSLDAALLLAAPAFIVWMILGAVSGQPRMGHELNFSPRAWKMVALGATLLVLVATIRSAATVVAMIDVGEGAHTSGWVAAATWDPGNYRINLRAAEIYSNRGLCEVARPFARRAAGLFPYSSEARRVANRCR